MMMHEGLGRGSSYLILARIVFLCSGYGVHIVAARLLGPESYGVIGIIISLMTVMNLFFISGFPKAAAKYLSEKKQWNKDVIQKAKKLQLLFLVVCFIVFLCLSPLIALFFGDTSLTRYIIATVLVIPFYALFSLYADGFLNGLRWFTKQAASSILFSTTKFVLVVGLLYGGFQLYGVIGGYLIAAFVGFLSGWYFFRTAKITGEMSFPAKKLVEFALPTLVFSLCVLLMFNIDLFLVKAVLRENFETGLYSSASMLARVPYFVFSGLAFALLPSISYSLSTKDTKKAKLQILHSVRYMTLILLPIIVLGSVTAKQLVVLVYSNVYRDAGSTLQILIVGLGFLSFFNILSHIMMGSSKQKQTVVIAGITFVCAVVLHLSLIPLYSIRGAAVATTIATGVGLCIVSMQVYRFHHVLLKSGTFFKAMFCAVCVGLLAWYFPFSGLLLFVQYGVLLVVYAGLLWIVREIDTKDIETLIHILPFVHQK